MLVFLGANGQTVTLPGDTLAATMIEIQQRAEAGEDAAALVRWLARRLVRARKAPARRRPGRRARKQT